MTIKCNSHIGDFEDLTPNSKYLSLNFSLVYIIKLLGYFDSLTIGQKYLHTNILISYKG